MVFAIVLLLLNGQSLDLVGGGGTPIGGYPAGMPDRRRPTTRNSKAVGIHTQDRLFSAAVAPEFPPIGQAINCLHMACSTGATQHVYQLSAAGGRSSHQQAETL